MTGPASAGRTLDFHLRFCFSSVLYLFGKCQTLNGRVVYSALCASGGEQLHAALVLCIPPHSHPLPEDVEANLKYIILPPNIPLNNL